MQDGRPRPDHRRGADGPLAFDNAVSAAAARTKGIASPVAGQADVLIVPDLESGNMLAKQLEYMGDAATAGIVLAPAAHRADQPRRQPRDAHRLLRGRGAAGPSLPGQPHEHERLPTSWC